KATLEIHNMPYGNPFLQAEFEVIDAVGRGRVHDAGAIFGGDEIGIDDEERRLVRDKIFIKRLIACSQQAFRIDVRFDLVVALQDREPSLREDVVVLALADSDM